jgi:hypothetical protein
MTNQTTDATPLVARILNEAKQWILERTVGIYFQMPDGNPVPWGTGVLLRIADESFVLSASHVLERASEATARLASCVAGSRFVNVTSVRLSRTVDTETLDVGFLRLTPENATELEVHKKFLRMSDLDTSQAMGDGAYLVAGYPAQSVQFHLDGEQKEISASHFSFLTQLVDVDRGEPGITLGLSFREPTLRNGYGELVRRVPELNGISGCGIWRVWLEENRDSLARWDPSWIRLSGIEHAVTPRRSIRGTLVGHALQLIARSQPELIPSMRVSLS